MLLKKIKIYNLSGKKPFVKWLDNLKDDIIRSKILRRIDRLSQGNYGDHRYLNKGLFELRMNVGSGYRNCGEEDKTIIIILCGGDKKS